MNVDSHFMPMSPYDFETPSSDEASSLEAISSPIIVAEPPSSIEAIDIPPSPFSDAIMRLTDDLDGRAPVAQFVNYGMDQGLACALEQYHREVIVAEPQWVAPAPYSGPETALFLAVVDESKLIV